MGPYLEKTLHKKGLVEWFKVQAPSFHHMKFWARQAVVKVSLVVTSPGEGGDGRGSSSCPEEIGGSRHSHYCLSLLF
jgi:hypothetical protein